MADWYYDMMAELDAADAGVLQQSEPSDITLPDVLTVPANDSNEINLDEYYSYAGFSDDGRKAVTENTFTAYDEYQQFQSNNSESSLEQNEKESSELSMEQSLNAAVIIVPDISTPILTAGDGHTGDTQSIGFVGPEQTTQPSNEQAFVATGRPRNTSSLHHKLASNPYFSELFADGAAPAYIPPSSVSSSGSNVSTLNTDEVPVKVYPRDTRTVDIAGVRSRGTNENKPPASSSSSGCSSHTLVTGGADLTSEYRRINSNLSDSATPKQRKVLRYIPPTDVDPWGDTEADSAALAKISSDLLVHTKLSVVDKSSYSSSSSANGSAAQRAASSSSSSSSTALEVSVQIGYSSTEQHSRQDMSNDGTVLSSNSNSSSYTHSVFTLGGLVPVPQANAVLHHAGKAILFVKDQALLGASRYVASNMYISSFIGCVNESLYNAADRARMYADSYLNTLTSDDPERRHLARIKNSTHWQSILLRYVDFSCVLYCIC